MKPEKRAAYIIISIGLARSSLLLFALVPEPYNILCMFINGLPLGVVFGLVFGFLEGRRNTELLGAVLATSFIFPSGLAKTTGKWLLLQYNVSEQWMPFFAGGIFAVPLLLSVWMLAKTPPPTAKDMQQRTPRKPMTAVERKHFLKTFGTTLIPVVIAYAVFTIVRDFCEDFANELWAETGYLDSSAIFAKTGTIISLFTLGIIGGFFLIRSNCRAFKISHYLVIGGVCMSIVATALFNLQYLNAFSWMLLSTAGIYMAYIPFNCPYFERMIAVYRIKSNVGFVMYIADAFGYLGTVIVLLVKEFLPIQYNWVQFFSFLFYGAAITGVILILIALRMHAQLIKQFNTDKSG